MSGIVTALIVLFTLAVVIVVVLSQRPTKKQDSPPASEADPLEPSGDDEEPDPFESPETSESSENPDQTGESSDWGKLETIFPFKLFSFEEGMKEAKNPAFRQALEAMDKILLDEEKDGWDKLANQSYWMHNGKLVATAAYASRKIAWFAIDWKSETIDFTWALERLAFGKYRFEFMVDDDAGYGAGTWHGGIRAIEAGAQKLATASPDFAGLVSRGFSQEDLAKWGFPEDRFPVALVAWILSIGPYEPLLQALYSSDWGGALRHARLLAEAGPETPFFPRLIRSLSRHLGKNAEDVRNIAHLPQFEQSLDQLVEAETPAFNPKGLDPLNVGQGFYWLGRSLRAKGKEEEARRAFIQSFSQDFRKVPLESIAALMESRFGDFPPGAATRKSETGLLTRSAGKMERSSRHKQRGSR